MAFNSVGQYTGTLKTWDHVGNLIPKVEHSEGVRPAIEWQVAAWLPVQFFDKYYENWMVVMPGKVLATDGDGRLVPAGLKIAAELDGSGDVVTYTLNDAHAGTLNVTTGKPVQLSELTDAGQTRGYTAAEVDAAGFMGRAGATLRISNPVGVAPYAFLQHAGGDGSNPVEFAKHNYNMQHQVAVLCDYVLELPLVPATTSAPESLTFGAPSNNVATSNALANLPVAANTKRTPLKFSGTGAATLFINQVNKASEVRASGDFHVDTNTGVVTVYSASTPSGLSLSYSHYASAPAAVSRFASAVGDLKAGDLVTFDANSNFCLADAASLFLTAEEWGDDAKAQVARSHGLVLGQVLDVELHPRDGLDKVRTAHVRALDTNASGSMPGYLGQLDQMPGTATGGVPANIHYAGAADRVVRINLTRF